MAARLRSASINQTLKSAFKATALALLMFWMRSSWPGFGITFLFLVAFTIFYTKPALRSGKYISSALTLAVIPFFIPNIPGLYEAVFTASWGLAFFFLLSTKNLLLLGRESMYKFTHFALVASLAILLVEQFSFTSQAVVFVALLFIFREFYNKFSEERSERTTLISSLEAFIFIEIAWMLTFLSIETFASVVFLAVYTYIFHDTTLHKLKDTITNQIVLRNGIIFATLAIVIIVISSAGTIF